MAVQTITVTVNNDLVEVCERTPQVRDAILAKLGETDCGNVGSEELATVSGTLGLNGKQITSLKSDDFYGLTALTVIWLNGNQLESLPEGIFSGLTALTSLHLQNNQLNNLPAGIFSDLTALRSIFLFSNRLSNLPAGIFSELTALTQFNLSYNQLESLPEGIFFGLDALEGISLRGNTVDPLTIEVSLEKVGESGFRAVAPTGAPFAMNVPVTVENGTIVGGATTVRIPVGAVESATLTVVYHSRRDQGRHRRHRHPAGAAQRPRWLCPAEIRAAAGGAAGDWHLRAHGAGPGRHSGKAGARRIAGMSSKLSWPPLRVPLVCPARGSPR